MTASRFLGLAALALSLSACAPALLSNPLTGQVTLTSVPANAGQCTSMIIGVEQADGTEVKRSLITERRTETLTLGSGEHLIRASCPDSSTPVTLTLTGRTITITGQENGTITVKQ